MSKLRTASICFTDLMEAAKAGHTAFSRSKNNKVYFNVAIWDNEQANQFGQNVSIQLSPKKDTESKALYIGNGTKKDNAIAEKITPEASTKLFSKSKSDDDLPF
jgi:hypothetical protein